MAVPPDTPCEIDITQRHRSARHRTASVRRRCSARWSRGTAGPSRSSRARRWGCTCRRPAGRPVRVEVAWIGRRRRGRARRRRRGRRRAPRRRWTRRRRGAAGRVALTIAVDPSWRSGYYEVVLEIDVGEKVRRDRAFFVVRPTVGGRPPRSSSPWPTNTWHAYNDFGGPQPLHRRHPGRHAAADGRRLPAQAARQGPPGHRHRCPRPAERRPRRLPPAQPPRRVGPARPGWPDSELPFIEWAEREGFTIGVCTNADLEEHPEVLDGAPAVPVGRPRRVLVDGHARHRRGVHRRRRQRRVLLRQHVAVAGAASRATEPAT